MGYHRKVFATRRLPAEVMERLGEIFDLSVPSTDRPLTRREIIRGLSGQEGLISMLSDPMDAAVLSRGSSLKVIANYAVGYNNIDLKAATARKIYVTNTPGVLTETTADLTWGLILAVGRRLIEADQLVRSGRWTGWAPTQLVGQDIYGKTLGIIGLGRIGRAVARRASGFDLRVLYFSRRRLAPPDEQRLGVRFAPLGTLLSESDFVSLHLPYQTETYHLIGKKQFSQMKPTAYLINTARGPVVDEKELIEALKAGWIAGAGLDVFEKEPKISRRLLRLKNVVVLPHIGSASAETRIRMGVMVLENLRAVFEGKAPPNWVNPF